MERYTKRKVEKPWEGGGKEVEGTVGGSWPTMRSARLWVFSPSVPMKGDNKRKVWRGDDRASRRRWWSPKKWTVRETAWRNREWKGGRKWWKRFDCSKLETRSTRDAMIVIPRLFEDFDRLSTSPSLVPFVKYEIRPGGRGRGDDVIRQPVAK